jgi:tripartite-type tricarboxylate transporter receptor subunit TctC
VAAGYRLGRTGELGFLGQLKRGKNMLARLTAAVCGILLALCGAAPAQNYPSKPLTMIIPFAAGGPTDVLGRVIAQRMSEIMGQQVVVENVGGAGGMTGSKRVADAASDGYTFVLGTVGTHAQGQSLYKKPLYNAATDFTAVALIAEVPIVLITRKDLPVNNLQGVRRLHEGQSGQDAVRLGRSRLCDSPGLRAAQLSHRGRYHARSRS